MVREPSLTLSPGDGLAAAPEAPAVFLIRPPEGRPYLARTSLLRRRLKRLVARWKLDDIAARIDCWLTASRLEQALLSYALAREHFPDDYERVLRLPRPPYVKLILGNLFPRTQITTRITGGRSLFYGPFPSRAAADLFEGQFLDLFQLRRCQEDLEPSPGHPGCIYGEMGRCLRPCQQAVTIDEYGAEARRVAGFLSSRGESLLASTAAARDRFSDELRFEEAARQHARCEKIEQVVKLGGELARDVSRLHGVAVTPSLEPHCVALWFVREGCWLQPRALSLAPGLTEPLDRRLRELLASLEPPETRLRGDHLALLARWFYSSWRDGEWLGFDSPDQAPYRKLVNAIHRVATQATVGGGT
jgi:excinuclease UvrABC nuclease subunit